MLSVFAALLYSFGQSLRRHTFDRRLARRIDIEDVKGVCVIERGDELIHQVAGSRIAVGLENYVNFVEVTLLRRSQRSANLCGMMTVIIDDADVVHAAAQLEAPINSAKL